MPRPKIIQAPSEDPREKAIALLLTIQEHDPNMSVEDQVFLGCAVRSCRYSLRMDEDKVTAPQLRQHIEKLLSPARLEDSYPVSDPDDCIRAIKSICAGGSHVGE